MGAMGAQPPCTSKIYGFQRVVWIQQVLKHP